MEKCKAALVLAGGGARGIAHIGAIEELYAAGYEITAVAGTSMGALVGGMFASGHLALFKEWLCGLDSRRVFELVDLVWSAEGLVKGDRVMDALRGLVPDRPIERLPLPFAAVAADVVTGDEVVLDSGSLYEAIRASISIPSVFRPVRRDGMILVDGAAVNPMPLDRVRRTEGDCLVGVDVSARYGDEPARRACESFNHYQMLHSASEIMQQRITRLMCELHRPDLLVELPTDSYGTFEFYRAAEIIEAGRRATRAALDRVASSQTRRRPSAPERSRSPFGEEALSPADPASVLESALRS